jgi:hypothetical protein
VLKIRTNIKKWGKKVQNVWLGLVYFIFHWPVHVYMLRLKWLPPLFTSLFCFTDSDVCKICMKDENKIYCAFVKCGHMLTCLDCATKLSKEIHPTYDKLFNTIKCIQYDFKICYKIWTSCFVPLFSHITGDKRKRPEFFFHGLYNFKNCLISDLHTGHVGCISFDSLVAQSRQVNIWPH